VKLHVYHSLCIRKILFKFRCDRWIMKGMFFKNKVPSPLISPSIPWAFLKLHTYHSLRMLCKWYTFGCDRSITKGTLLEKQSTFCIVPRLVFHGSFCNSTPAIQCARATIGISLVAILSLIHVHKWLVLIQESDFLCYAWRWRSKHRHWAKPDASNSVSTSPQKLG